MNTTKLSRTSRLAILVLAVLTAGVAPSFAQTTYDLCASDGTVIMPDSAVVPIWGYADITGGGPCAVGLATLPGPELRATAGDTLTINLSNALAVPVSFFVPGYRATVTGGSPGMITPQVPAGGTATYTLAPLRAGTFLYQSATDLRTQVPMGLYGALVVDVAPGQAYGDVTYDQDEVLVFSEIDPALNADPAGFGGARISAWSPRYFLIDGAAFPATAPLVVNVGQDVLLRLVNAGLETVVPSLEGGLYMDLVAEDGFRYPQPLQQYAVELTAAKTLDAVVNVGTAGSYALYDRALALTNQNATGGGMLTYLQAGVAAGAPTAVDDAYSVAEDASLVTVAAGVPPGVLDNDTDPENDPLTAFLVSDVAAGTLVLAADGSFTYTPNADFNGADLFTYRADDGTASSNVATVTLTVTPVNDAPVAVADAYDEEEGIALSVAAPGVLGNDLDVDGDLLTAALVSGPTVILDADLSATGPGVLMLAADGSFTHDPAGTGLNAGDQVAFDYQACDPAPLCSTTTATITIVPPAANLPPFANDDFAETVKNSAGITFSVTANDVDPDGTIDVTTVVITTGPNTQRGGTVVENGDGTVTYVPKNGFRGTDIFGYTVNDDDGATSNEATVRINVL